MDANQLIDETRKMQEEAQNLILSGRDPESLAHAIYYPKDAGGGFMFFSNPLPPGSNLSGLISEYKTLREWAAM